MIKGNYFGKHNFPRGSAHPLWDSWYENKKMEQETFASQFELYGY